MKIAILASGVGTNAENIINYFHHNSNYQFLIITNNSDAGVIKKSLNLNINYLIIGKNDSLINILKENQIDFIVLAGYLKLIPIEVINYYTNKIVNIHPSLLPKYGGKGMFGMNVHKKVINNKEVESGITIHYVSENYDEGQIIEQHKCEVILCDTPEILAKKISLLERDYFPKCIEKLLI